MPKFKIVQNMVDKLNLVSREILTGLPVIRAFHTEKHEEERFDKANKDLTKTELICQPCHDIYDADYDACDEWDYRSDCVGRWTQY